MQGHYMSALNPKKPFWSAPSTIQNSLEQGRKVDHPRDHPEGTAMLDKMAVREMDDVTPRPSVLCDVTAECFLSLVVTSLTVLTMVAAMTVLVIHFVSGGKIFLKNRDAGKNSTSGLKPHFNFKT